MTVNVNTLRSMASYYRENPIPMPEWSWEEVGPKRLR